MRLREITEAVGRITKQNQTADVGPQEIKTQAAKFGNTVDKDGRPPTLSKKTKGSKTNVLYNLGLAESILDELNIPRNQMPQISMKDLKADYDLEKDMVDPASLETSQDQRIPGMVDKTVQSIKDGFDKPLVVDKDGFIVNGHHRYDAYLKLNAEKVPIIRVKDASIEELIRDFSHTAKDTYAEHDIAEKWSKKYKDSIDCSNPKGFSQKAHCAGKKKNENFADGKTKGKSRPGRAKRAGVDCSKSISALRKQAKNSSGEKQKMAHWCANMKSGRKKS